MQLACRGFPKRFAAADEDTKVIQTDLLIYASTIVALETALLPSELDRTQR